MLDPITSSSSQMYVFIAALLKEKNHRMKKIIINPKTHNNCVFSRERNKTNNTNFEKASKLLSNVVVRQHFCQYSI